jgi:hypothetical protein
MKRFTIIFLLFLSFYSFSQKEEKKNRFGCAINSGILSSISRIGIAPTATYLIGKNQLEFGIVIYPFSNNNYQMFSCDFNYKYFPNGIANRFNLFFETNFNFFHTTEFRHFHPNYDFYDIKKNQLNLNGGYGFQYNVFKKTYIGTNINIGIGTENRIEDRPDFLPTKQLFNNYYLNVGFGINIGYRF